MNVVDTAMTILGSVRPLHALLWWLAAVVLAVLLVYAWQRVFNR